MADPSAAGSSAGQKAKRRQRAVGPDDMAQLHRACASASRTTGAEWKRVPIANPAASACHVAGPVRTEGA